MKICHLTTVHPAKDTRIFHKECRTLADVGFEVTLLVGNGPNEVDGNVRIVGVPTPASRIKRILFSPKILYRKALEIDADVYHFHDPEFLRCAARLQRRGKKVIYDVHEDVPRQIRSKYWIPGPLRGIIANRTEALENRVARKLSAIVTATPYIRDRFLKLNPNTVDVNNYPVLDQFDYSEGNRERTVAYVGGITEVRGIRELVRAVAGTDIRLQLAGKFSPESLEAEIRAEPGWANVDFHGFLDRKGIKDLLAKAGAGAVTLYPIINYLDALPVKMFEYMASGVPVISSDIALWKQIVDDSASGVTVDPKDPEAIRQALVAVLDDQDGALAMGRNGRKAAEEQYNWKQEADKLVTLYRKL